MVECSIHELNDEKYATPAARTSGMKRAHNEDNFFLLAEENLYVVADGMGGHASGEVALADCRRKPSRNFFYRYRPATGKSPGPIKRAPRCHIRRKIAW